MERYKEEKKKKKYKKECFDKRSPLQDLNGHRILKTRSSNPSNAVSIETLKCSNSSSSSSSSSRTQFDKKLNTFSRFANNAPNKSTAAGGSKENEIPRKIFPQKSKKIQLFSYQLQSGKKNANPISKSGQRSKLSSDKENPKLKKGFRDFGGKMRISISQRNDGSGKRPTELLKMSGNCDLNCVQNCTPVGKIACGSGSYLVVKNIGDDSMPEKCNDNSDTAVKTPPVEASVSPEINCESHSKLLVSKSGATPVCYGAGHLLSGVTDKRKCRRRGSLKGGCEKANLFHDERSDGNVISDMQNPSVPLLAEASVRWHLSPCDEGDEDRGIDSGIRTEQCRVSLDNVSNALDLLSSPSSLCGNVSELVRDIGSFSGSDSVGDVASKRKAGMVAICPRKDSEFHCLFKHSNEKMDEYLLAASPNSNSECNTVSKGERESFSPFQVGDYSRLSIGSLSSGNVIQTPNSDSSLEIDQSYFIQSELHSIRQNLNEAGLSPRSEMLMWDERGLGSHFVDVPSPLNSMNMTQPPKNRYSASSGVYDSSLENLALSQMRISWRDGVASRIVENDEFDYCRCLSDEDIDTDGCSKEKIISYPPTEKENDDCGLRSCLGNKSGVNDENHLNINSDLDPKVLDYEPIISAKNKEKLCPHMSNTCAESICTTGGSLVASGDSDWGSCFSNRSFQD